MPGPALEDGPHDEGAPYERVVLTSHWSLCSALPSEPAGPLGPALAQWIPIPALGTAAAALRDVQDWSLDEAPRRFDALDWWYRLEFAAAPASPGERVLLGFDGLATLAQVWLNGRELLHSDNMFVAHVCDVSRLLQPTGNTLLLRFAALDTALAQRRPRPRWRAPMVEHQQLRWLRTTLLGRTPGWSVPAAAVGPWKDIWLERRRDFEWNGLRLQPRVQGTDGRLHCALQLVSLGTEAVASAVLHVKRQGRSYSQALSPGQDGRWSAELQVPDVDLWWPHTHGQAALYEVCVRVCMDAGTDEGTGVAATCHDLPLGRVGFRTLSISTTDGDFSLRVNGVPVFCRGACWTPLDPVSLRAAPQAYRVAIAQACAAGMNMLRVAGTMVYEDDAFFDACDAAGMLVWQDFMFANMDFPFEDAAFAASVALEVRQQLARLASRASLAVLCGNSEVSQQAAMWGAAKPLWGSTLFEAWLPALCAEQAPDTAYWPSSAHGGAFPHQGHVGTTSYYGVGAYQRGLDDARRSGLKFASECLAFANIPEDSALQRMPTGLAVRVHHPAWKARSPRDLGAGWDFDDVRDHYLAQVFALDPNKLRYADHGRYLVLGRMASGEAMAAAFAEWRRPGSVCRGALVLFLRDLWAGAGWGLVDDAGVPKACYYYLKRVLQPTAVLLSDEGGNGLFAHVLNEGPTAQELELELSAWRAPAVQVASAKRTLSLPAHGSCSLAAQELFEHFLDLNFAYRFGPSPCDVVVATLRDGRAQVCGQAIHFPVGMALQSLGDPGLQANCQVLDAQTVQVTLSTHSLALGVHFDVAGYVPDDAYFPMAPLSQVQVVLRSAEPRTFFGTLQAANAWGTVSLSISP